MRALGALLIVLSAVTGLAAIWAHTYTTQLASSAGVLLVAGVPLSRIRKD